MSYIDPSAALKLVVAEPEAAALAEGLATDRRLAASWLLHAELHCAAGRFPEAVDISEIQRVLDSLISLA